MNDYTGIVQDLPDAEYRAAPGYGSTALKWFLNEVPAQAKWWIDHPEDAPTFEGSALGTLFHALVLNQPHRFIVKDWKINTKDGKSRAAEVLHEHGGPEGFTGSAEEFDEAFAGVGVELITQSDFDLAAGMAEGARKHPTVRAMLDRPGSAEASVFHVIDDVKCKARIDWLPEPDGGRLVLLDLKSAFSAHPKKFTKNAANFDYAVQHGDYRDLIEAEYDVDTEFLFVVTDKRRPHLTSLVGLPQEPWARIGRERAAKARSIIRDCEQSGMWPGYGDGVHYIDPPTWYVMQSEDEEIQ